MLRRVTSATFAASICMMVTIPVALAGSTAVRCDGRWHSIPNGLHGAANTPLSSVSGISKDDVWAVGRHGLQNGRSRALILHWNGSSWASVAPPDVSYTEWLFAVDAMATDDAWAVGWAAERRHNHALIEHWDGSAWTQSPAAAPPPGSVNETLSSVSGTGPDDAWAVGRWNDTSSGPGHPLIEHWNGTSWSIVSSPQPGGGQSFLNDVWAVSRNLAWAVGSTVHDGFVLRWDGSSWTVADGPRRGSLQTVWAGSDTAAWAAAQPFEHWNGSGWRVVSVDAHDSNISDAGGRPGVVWAVGSRYVGVNQTVTTILRRDASGWHLVDSPSPGSGQNDLGGVATVPGGGSWAVGSRNGRSTLWNALIEHIC